jgi:hypothetical protein
MVYTLLECYELHKHYCDIATFIKRPSWEANSCSAMRDILRAFMSPTVDCCVHKGPSLKPLLRRFNPVQTLSISAQILSSLLRMRFFKDFITLIMSGEKHQL